jgi:hypothetical protein
MPPLRDEQPKIGLRSYKAVVIAFNLDENAARTLLALLQNPPGDPADEPDNLREFREELFDGIKRELDKQCPRR